MCGGESSYVFFFFQAEDGIRDYKVTGVQTCALPICDYTRDESDLTNHAQGKACAQAYPLAQAHWKLYPPSQPVMSTTSPMQYRPGWVLHSMVCCESARVSTPPSVTSAFL